MLLTDNIISYWKLDESSGNAVDSAGSNTGINTSVTYGTGKINNGAIFNGSSSRLDCGTSTTLKPTSVSFSGWAKTSLSTAGYIFSKVSDYLGGHIAYGIFLSSGKVCVRIQQSATPTFIDLQVTETFNDNIFHHYAFTYNGTTLLLYMDGVQIGTSSGGAIYYGGDFSAAIGATNDSLWENFFTGTIDEVGIWARVLSLAEIQSLYNGILSINLLVVAGGGSGGSNDDREVDNGGSGGGGAGGYYSNTTYAVTAKSYSVTVGAGGAVAGGQYSGGNSGSNSVFDSITMTGGGGGGGNIPGTNGGSGGSGGGGGQRNTGGSGIGGQGYAGGNGSSGSYSGAGGGGGSSGVGSNDSGGTGGSYFNSGGSGTSNSISGSSVTYSAGGRGAHNGGGGNSAVLTPNTGSGSDGTGFDFTHYAGSDGIVVISYPVGLGSATGGTKTTQGSNYVHTFTTSGTWTSTSIGNQFPFQGIAFCRALVVAGGGAGGPAGLSTGSGGGGGAGGYIYSTGTFITPGPLSVTVGAGGGGGSSGSGSIFNGLNAVGGGRGGAVAGGGGIAGGSGGGAGSNAGTGYSPGGVGTAGQGNNGGTATNAGYGGGGGGAGSVGTNGTTSVHGNGGSGITNPLTGSGLICGGGGSGNGGTGTNGGGNGGSPGGSGGSPGATNTGSGGGGGAGGSYPSYSGGAGGSGLVQIAFPIDGSTGLSTYSYGGTITQSGGYQIHTFTTSGTFFAVSSVLFTETSSLSIMNSVGRHFLLDNKYTKYLSVFLENAYSRFATILSSSPGTISAPILSIRQTFFPYSIISSLNYKKTSILGTILPVLNNEKSDNISFRIYNNYGGVSGVVPAINVSVTTYDGTGHTASMQVASQQWLHVQQSGWGSGSSGPAQYTKYLGTDTMVGGSSNAYYFEYGSSGKPSSPNILTGNNFKSCGFLEVQTYIKPSQIGVAQNNVFVISISYEYVI